MRSGRYGSTLAWAFVTALVASVVGAPSACNSAGTEMSAQYGGPQRTPRIVKLAEEDLRRSAVNQSMPRYPRASVERGVQGVAVAAIVVGLDGRTEAVTVLQAPDSQCEEAVREALMRWMFGPVQVKDFPDERWRLEGRVTFYFRFRGGQPVVLNPEQVASELGRSNAKVLGRGKSGRN